MDDPVLVLADEVLGIEAGQDRSSRVDEGGATFSVQAIDPFPRRVQDEFVPTRELVDCLAGFCVLSCVLDAVPSAAHAASDIGGVQQ
jgi:hypothetical protein